MLTGASQLSASIGGDRVVFTAFYRGGYDIYLWKTPFQDVDSLRTLPLTKFREREQRERHVMPFLAKATDDDSSVVNAGRESRPYRNLVFGDDFRQGKTVWGDDRSSRVVLPASQRMQPDGTYNVKKYAKV